MVDVWSAGVVLYAMLYGNFPFKATNVEELEQQVLSGIYSLSPDISEESRDLLSRILCSDPQTRLTIPEILSHPWMKVVDESSKLNKLFNTSWIVCLFSQEEIDSIKKEYSYKQKSQENSINEDSNSSIFTEHNLDTTENDQDLSKSTILAPFNSIESKETIFMERVKRIAQNKKVIKFNSKIRECDRKYERNNNSKLDNGVYVQLGHGIGKVQGLQNLAGLYSPKGNSPMNSISKCTTSTTIHYSYQQSQGLSINK